jgi:hypothetical protein
MRREQLNWYERLFVKAIDALAQSAQGFHLSFTDELVREHGIKGFFKFGAASEACWNDILKHFGELDAHLLASMASFWNGCDYCAHGHMLAHNLLIYEETGQLFPLDEETVGVLMRKPDAEMLDFLRHLLADRTQILKHLERLFELRNGLAKPDPASPDDVLLMRAVGLYEWMNECSITVRAPAPPLGPVAKKKDLLRRYQAARQATRGQPPPAAPVGANSSPA